MTSLAELAREQVTAAMEAWRARMRAHARRACVHVLVNERREGGASLPHTHAQLYALDFVPPASRASASASRLRDAHDGRQPAGDLVQEEVRRRERLVAIDDEAVLLAPYASRLPFQLMLARAARAPASRTTARSAPRCCTTALSAWRAASAPRRR